MAAVHSVPTSSVTTGACTRATGVATVVGALSAPATGAELVSLVGLLPLRQQREQHRCNGFSQLMVSRSCLVSLLWFGA